MREFVWERDGSLIECIGISKSTLAFSALKRGTDFSNLPRL